MTIVLRDLWNEETKKRTNRFWLKDSSENFEIIFTHTNTIKYIFPFYCKSTLIREKNNSKNKVSILFLSQIYIPILFILTLGYNRMKYQSFNIKIACLNGSYQSLFSFRDIFHWIFRNKKKGKTICFIMSRLTINRQIFSRLKMSGMMRFTYMHIWFQFGHASIWFHLLQPTFSRQ